MEFILSNLPDIFCYLSGILIAWSGFILFNFFHILQHAKTCGRKFRRGDIFQTSVIGAVGVALSVALFIVPQYAAEVMDLLLVLNCWYLAFLISVTSTKSYFAIQNAANVNVPTLTVVQSTSKTELV